MLQLSYDLTWQKLKEKFSHCGAFSPTFISLGLNTLAPGCQTMTAVVVLKMVVVEGYLLVVICCRPSAVCRDQDGERQVERLRDGEI